MKRIKIHNRERAEATALFRKVSVATGMALLATAATTRGSTDYGPAIWHPICSPNYYTSGSGHKFHVIHDMEGYYASVVAWFDDCNMTSASIHYAVNGKQDAGSDAPAGEVTQLGVRDSQYAWHARCWNQHSTGTEHEGFANNPAWYTEAMYQASAGVTKNLASKFGWAKDRNHIVGHNAKTVSGWSAWASANLGIDPNCNSHVDPGAYWDWNHYMALINNANIAPGPDAESRYSGNVELFTRRADNHLMGKYYDSATGWSGWGDHASNCSSDPSPVAWDRDHMSVFWRGTDGALWVKGWTAASGWGTPISLGGALIGGPDGCSMRAGRIDIFCRGTDNTLQHRVFENNAWGPWESLGGVLTADPSAVTWGDGRIDVFVRDTFGALNQKVWTSTGGWSGWNQIGGQIIGSPDACSMRSGRLDIFVRELDNSLGHISWELNWSGWESLGGIMASDPGCTSWGNNRIDVFLRAADNQIDQKTWTSTGGWSGWIGLGIP